MSINKYIRGVRVKMPTGYVLGRTDAGPGKAHLIKIGPQGVAAGANSGGGGVADRPIGFGFYIGGMPANNELIGTATFSVEVYFPSGVNDSVVTSQIEAASSAVFHMKDAVNTTVGTITFAAGSKVGVVAWSPNPYYLAAGAPVTLYAPTPADASLAFISGIVQATRA